MPGGDIAALGESTLESTSVHMAIHNYQVKVLVCIDDRTIVDDVFGGGGHSIGTLA